MSDASQPDAPGLVRALVAAGKTLSGAESCTGGLVASAITSVPGASEAFLGSVVAYANKSKNALLGVRNELLAEHGAVSEACALAMARGALDAFGSDWAYATTGIAGPGGGSADKPVGTVWIAYGTADNLVSERLRLQGTRDKVRQATVEAVLDRILSALLR